MFDSASQTEREVRYCIEKDKEGMYLLDDFLYTVICENDFEFSLESKARGLAAALLVAVSLLTIAI